MREHEIHALLIRLLREAEDNNRETAHVLHESKQTTHQFKEFREELKQMQHTLRKIEREIAREHPTPTDIVFKEITMNPTQGGNTQVFTGVLVPAGATFPADTIFGVTSNDPALSPTVDSTGLIVTGPLPVGWVESTITPLAYAYTATSASTGGSLSKTITPSAPVIGGGFPSDIVFSQSQ